MWLQQRQKIASSFLFPLHLWAQKLLFLPKEPEFYIKALLQGFPGALDNWQSLQWDVDLLWNMDCLIAENRLYFSSRCSKAAKQQISLHSGFLASSDQILTQTIYHLRGYQQTLNNQTVETVGMHWSLIIGTNVSRNSPSVSLEVLFLVFHCRLCLHGGTCGIWWLPSSISFTTKQNKNLVFQIWGPHSRGSRAIWRCKCPGDGALAMWSWRHPLTAHDFPKS